MTPRLIILISASLSVSAPAGASTVKEAARPPALVALVGCRSLSDADRLPCYDRQVAVLDEAERKRDVVIVDRAEIQRTRRSLFGFTLPALKLFGKDDKNTPPFEEIETTLASATRSSGQWLFTLEDGSRWLQADSIELSRTPKSGQNIRIRKAALGSFLAKVGGQPAVRVRRLN